MTTKPPFFKAEPYRDKNSGLFKKKPDKWQYQSISFDDRELDAEGYVEEFLRFFVSKQNSMYSDDELMIDFISNNYGNLEKFIGDDIGSFAAQRFNIAPRLLQTVN